MHRLLPSYKPIQFNLLWPLIYQLYLKYVSSYEMFSVFRFAIQAKQKQTIFIGAGTITVIII